MFYRLDRHSGVLCPPSLAGAGWPALAAEACEHRQSCSTAAPAPKPQNPAWPHDTVGGNPIPTWAPRADHLLGGPTTEVCHRDFSVVTAQQRRRGGVRRRSHSSPFLCTHAGVPRPSRRAVATCEALPAREPVRASACSGAGHRGTSTWHLPGLQILCESTFPWHLRSPSRLRTECEATG